MSVFNWLAALPIVLVAAIVLSELGARWWLRTRSSYYVWPPYYRHIFGLDPKIFPNFPSPVHFTVNREGERGAEIPRNYEKLYRVLVAGGSAPECYILDQEASWPTRLQRILERAENLKKLGASHVHVGNIGRSGVGSEALELILRMVLPRVERLDLAIIMVGASDVFHWLQAGAPPAAVREVTTTSDLSKFFSWQPLGPFSRRPRQTALAHIARRARQIMLRPVRRSTDAGDWLRRARESRACATEVRTQVRDAHVMVDNFDVYLRKAIQVAKAKADRVIVVRQPWLSKVDKLEWEHLWHGSIGDVFRHKVKAFYSSDVLCDLMVRIDERALRVAHDIGVECCEVRSAIEPSFDSYYDLVHFTPSSAAVVASILARSVLREPTPGDREYRAAPLAGVIVAQGGRPAIQSNER